MAFALGAHHTKSFVACICLLDSFVTSGLPKVTHYSQNIELPRGCAVEIAMILTYHARQLCDRTSCWWVVPYTQLSANVVAFLLLDVYDSSRLWFSSTEIICKILRLDFVQMLELTANADDVELFLRGGERTNISTLPYVW